MVEAGEIWRNTTIEPFGDHVVLRVEDRQVLLARPYAYASESSRQPLLGSEVYSLHANFLCGPQWKRIEKRRVL